ncbi:MAG: carbohydrate ABC transporter substrate-binding protein, partial [Brachybacterium tyrofermentans]
AHPGDDAATNGLTVWLPSGLYIPTYAENTDAAKAFLAFAVSAEGLDALNSLAPPTGPSMVKGIPLPEDVPAAVQDLQIYFDEEGRTTPALEFSSPIKGPNLENILIELGTGAIDAKTAAERYDQDVEKQAQQLGLEGW